MQLTAKQIEERRKDGRPFEPPTTAKPAESQITGFLHYVSGDRTPALPKVTEVIETHCGGRASSSKCVRLSLIPREAQERLAGRFELGIQNHGERAWNAQSGNQEILTDLDFLATRIDHAMMHLMSLSEKVANAKRSGQFQLGDDDPAAIAFFGAFACCATKAILDKQAEEDRRDAVEAAEALAEDGHIPLSDVEAH